MRGSGRRIYPTGGPPHKRAPVVNGISEHAPAHVRRMPVPGAPHQRIQGSPQPSDFPPQSNTHSGFAAARGRFRNGSGRQVRTPARRIARRPITFRLASFALG